MSFDAQITFLHTDNLIETAAFYEQVLGLPLVLDQGTCRIYRVAGAAFVGFCTHGVADSARAGVVLTLVTNAVDAWYAQLLARGVVFEKPPALNARFEIYHCFLRDPNGYLLEIQQFRDPRWQMER
ncbi:MAG: VOC family protein [Anaerolineales bacterium]